MDGNLITEEQLKEWLGYEQRAALEKALTKNRIPFITGKDGRVCTTSQALEYMFKPQSVYMTGDPIEF